MPDRIILESLAFDGRTGLLPGERDTGVRFRVDVELEVDLAKAGRSDRLADTIDYRHVADLVLEVGTQRSFQLVEKLTGEIAREILDRFRTVDAVTVQVRKLVPVLSGHPDAVAIRITRRR